MCHRQGLSPNAKTVFHFGGIPFAVLKLLNYLAFLPMTTSDCFVAIGVLFIMPLVMAASMLIFSFYCVFSQ